MKTVFGSLVAACLALILGSILALSYAKPEDQAYQDNGIGKSGAHKIRMVRVRD